MNNKKEDTTRIDGKKVDREVGEAFKKYVMEKHGRIRGVFSSEITKALAMYLDREGEMEKGNKGALLEKLEELDEMLETLKKKQIEDEKQLDDLRVDISKLECRREV